MTTSWVIFPGKRTSPEKQNENKTSLSVLVTENKTSFLENDYESGSSSFKTI